MYLREKNTNCITFNTRLNEIKTVRYTEIRRTSMKIQQLLKQDLLLFHNVSVLDSNRGKLTTLFFFSKLFCGIEYFNVIMFLDTLKYFQLKYSIKINCLFKEKIKKEKK